MSEQRGARPAIVTGATGLVGHFLLPLLRERGAPVQAVSRYPPPPGGSGAWRQMDLRHPAREEGTPLARAEVVFHTAPLWLLPPWLTTFARLGVRRLVAFSSTSRLTKESSGHPKERETARRLADAESAVAEVCPREGIHWTVFRPTLIYGAGRDRNVTDIARVIRWLGFFPVAGAGRGRRQPVHAEDLARACVDVLENRATFDQIYELPGGETLGYCEMVSRIARGLGRRPRLLHVPLPLLRVTLNGARRLPGFGHLTPDVATRMEDDLVFDPSRAARDFGYHPRPFRFPDTER